MRRREFIAGLGGAAALAGGGAGAAAPMKHIGALVIGNADAPSFLRNSMKDCANAAGLKDEITRSIFDRPKGSLAGCRSLRQTWSG